MNKVLAHQLLVGWHSAARWAELAYFKQAQI